MVPNLTQRELMLLEDQLSVEEQHIKQFQNYAEEASDAEIKNLCTKLAKEHQDHFGRLLKQLK